MAVTSELTIPHRTLYEPRSSGLCDYHRGGSR